MDSYGRSDRGRGGQQQGAVSDRHPSHDLAHLGYPVSMTKQQALDVLTGWKEDDPDVETEDKITTAIDHDNTITEVADRMGILPDTLRQRFPRAISEAGRLGHVRWPHDPALHAG